MNEKYVSTCRVIAALAWGSVVTMMVTAWFTVMTTEHWHEALMLAATSGIVAAFAAVMHVRVYFIRTCSLLRALHGNEGGSSSLRPIP